MSRESNRRFHFIREIASGTFGGVHLAKELHANGFSRLVAVKLLHRRWAESEEVVQRLRDEARLLGWLRHRHIVDVLDLTSLDGRTAVVMEYLEAVDARLLTEELGLSDDTIPMKAALQVGEAVAGALDAAYNRPPYEGERPLRVIHRDIKPSNIMIGEGGLVKVLDFGVARADFETRESSTRDLQFGSVDYMPPERLFFEPETPASDIYSLAVTLYEIMALERLGKAKGRPDRHAVFVRDRLSYLRAFRGLGAALANRLEQLFIAMLAYDHSDRPNAAEVASSCKALAAMASDTDLKDWTDQAIGPLLAAQRARQTEEGSLADQVLEDDADAISLRTEVDRERRLRSPAALSINAPDAPRVDPVPPETAAAGQDEPTPMDAPTVFLEPEEPEEAPTVMQPVDEVEVEGAHEGAPPPVEPSWVRQRSHPRRTYVMGQQPPSAPLHLEPEEAPTTVSQPEPPQATHHLEPEEAPTTVSQPEPPAATRTLEPDGAAAPAKQPASARPPRPQRRRRSRSAPVVFIMLLLASPVLGALLGLLIFLVVLPAVTGSPSPISGLMPPRPPLGPAPSEPGEPATAEPADVPHRAADVIGAAAAPPEAVPATEMIFSTPLSDLRRLQVRCESAEAGGSGQASMVLREAETCTVTALMSDRSRRTAVIQEAGPGSWICFSTDENRCEPAP